MFVNLWLCVEFWSSLKLNWWCLGMEASMRELQSMLGQITGWCEMAGRNSWICPPCSSWNMGPQIMWGRQSLSCSGWRFLSGRSRHKHVWSLRTTSTHQLPSFIYSSYGIKAKQLYNFVVIPGQSTNSFLQKLQIRRVEPYSLAAKHGKNFRFILKAVIIPQVKLSCVILSVPLNVCKLSCLSTSCTDTICPPWKLKD